MNDFSDLNNLDDLDAAHEPAPVLDSGAGYDESPPAHTRRGAQNWSQPHPVQKGVSKMTLLLSMFGIAIAVAFLVAGVIGSGVLNPFLGAPSNSNAPTPGQGATATQPPRQGEAVPVNRVNAASPYGGMTANQLRLQAPASSPVGAAQVVNPVDAALMAAEPASQQAAVRQQQPANELIAADRKAPPSGGVLAVHGSLSPGDAALQTMDERINSMEMSQAALFEQLDELTNRVNSLAENVSHQKGGVSPETEKKFEEINKSLRTIRISLGSFWTWVKHVEVRPGWHVSAATKKKAVIVGPKGEREFIRVGDRINGSKVLSIDPKKLVVRTTFGVIRNK